MINYLIVGERGFWIYKMTDGVKSKRDEKECFLWYSYNIEKRIHYGLSHVFFWHSMSMRSTSAQVWSAVRHQQIWRNQSPVVLCFNHRRHQYCTYWPLIAYAILNNLHVSCLRSYFHSFLLSSLNRNVVMTCMLTSIT